MSRNKEHAWQVVACEPDIQGSPEFVMPEYQDVTGIDGLLHRQHQQHFNQDSDHRYHRRCIRNFRGLDVKRNKNKFLHEYKRQRLGFLPAEILCEPAWPDNIDHFCLNGQASNVTIADPSIKARN